MFFCKESGFKEIWIRFPEAFVHAGRGWRHEQGRGPEWLLRLHAADPRLIFQGASGNA
jgi:hypothetical protein